MESQYKWYTDIFSYGGIDRATGKHDRYKDQYFKHNPDGNITDFNG